MGYLRNLFLPGVEAASPYLRPERGIHEILGYLVTGRISTLLRPIWLLAGVVLLDRTSDCHFLNPVCLVDFCPGPVL